MFDEADTNGDNNVDLEEIKVAMGGPNRGGDERPSGDEGAGTKRSVCDVNTICINNMFCNMDNGPKNGYCEPCGDFEDAH